MNKKQYYNESLKMIKAMARNTFLMPDSWSDRIELNSWKTYKTYIDKESRNYRIYADINIWDINWKEIIKICIRQNEILLDNTNIFGKIPTAKQVYEYILEIYNEKHSFIESNEGRKSVLRKIWDKNKEISNNKKQLEDLKKQLSDFDSLITKL